MPHDLDKYLPLLDGIDLPTSKKIELLLALSVMAQGFVDRAFGKLPGQQLPLGASFEDSQKPIKMICLSSPNKTERSAQ
ncbi:MAG: hypothetical protein ACPGNV_05125 [Mangrovicoccus sp.]